MSIADVPEIPPTRFPDNAIRSGKVVRGWTWGPAADLINWLTARGSMIVCGNQPNLAITAGNSGTLRYYAWPRGIHSRRVWVLYMSSIAIGGEVATVTINSLVFKVGIRTPTTALWFQLDNPPQPFFLTESYTATTTPGEITLTVAASAAAGVLVQRVLCFDVPRSRIEVDNAEGAAGEASRGFAIYQADERGLYGIATAADAGRDNFIRSNLHWFNSTGFSTNSTSYTPVFNNDPKCLGRAMSAADGATVDVTVAARMNGTGGADAYLQVTAASGDTLELTTSSATPVWVTGTLTIDREDLTDTDTGGQSGRLLGDALTFEAKKTATGTAAVITGLAVGEPL